MPRTTSEPTGRAWCFTLHFEQKFECDVDEDTACELFISLRDLLEDGRTSFCMQMERGENEGTLHVQGCLKWKNARSFGTTKSILTRAGFKNPHVEKVIDWSASVFYCSRGDKRVPGTRCQYSRVKFSLLAPEMAPDPLEGVEVRDWQSDVLDELKLEPDDRTINWIWDEHGGAGKTALCKHLVLRQQALYVSGAAKDILYAVKTCIEERGPPSIVLFDIPRCTDEKFISYGAIESVKNGLAFAAKYESGTICFKCPHVYIFANHRPDESKLSADRWNTRCIDRSDWGWLV